MKMLRFILYTMSFVFLTNVCQGVVDNGCNTISYPNSNCQDKTQVCDDGCGETRPGLCKPSCHYSCCIPAQCEAGWIRSNASCKCYLYSTIQKKWNNAQVDCNNNHGGAILAEPLTLEEITFLQQGAMNRGNTYWIGGNDLANENVFVWTSSSQIITVTDWAEGEPNDADGEDCVNIHEKLSFKWNDAYCKDSFYYICEKSTFNP